MAEYIKNYVCKIVQNDTAIIVPTAIKKGVNGEYGFNFMYADKNTSNTTISLSREENTTCIVSSFIISMANVNDVNTTPPLLIDVYIDDYSQPTSYRNIICSNINIYPSSAYYLEKPLTLNPNQMLLVKLHALDPAKFPNHTGLFINVTCGTVLST